NRNALMVEADGTEVQIAPLDRQFQSAPLINRILTNFAGPFNNLILAIIAFIIMAFLQGGVISDQPIIGDVLADSPAAGAGMEAGDEIIELNGQEISSWMEAVLLIQDSPNEQVNLTLEKENGSQETVTVVPESVTVETGEKI